MAVYIFTCINTINEGGPKMKEGSPKELVGGVTVVSTTMSNMAGLNPGYSRDDWC